jgi:hypothetical protein
VFMEYNKDFYKEISSIFRHVWKREARIFMKFPLPNDPSRLAGAWTGCVINIGTKHCPIKTKIHRDVDEGPYGVSCLYPFGDITDGDVILWEMGLRIELRPGDLLFFSDGILHHSNKPVTGKRHSLIAFTPLNVFHYWHRKYKYEDPRLTDLKIRREEYQRTKKTIESIIRDRGLESKKGKPKVRCNRKKLAASYLRS